MRQEEDHSAVIQVDGNKRFLLLLKEVALLVKDGNFMA